MSEGINEIEVDIHEICRKGDAVTLKEVLETEEFYPEVLFERDDEGFTPYHLSLLYSNPDCVSLLLSQKLDLQVAYQGFMPIHLALFASGFSFTHTKIIQTVLILIKYQQDITFRDRLGRTALHMVCASGLSDLIPILISNGIKPELKDFSGKMAIHYAIENYQLECLRQIIQEGGSDMFFCLDNRGDKPIHLAVRCGSWHCFNELISLASEEMLNEYNEFEQTPEEVAKNCGLHDEFLRAKAGGLFTSSLYTGTVVVTDEFCKHHAAIPESLQTPELLYKHLKMQPENPKRLDIMMTSPHGTLLSGDLASLTWHKNIGQACICDVLRVHEFSYVSLLKASIQKIPENTFPQRFDIDTIISSESYKAALIAANCVITAVDHVMQGRFKNAFCAVRPPGHHVGPYGAVGSEEDPGSKSTGFCLFNNLAIGAAYAKYHYASEIKKIAIVDFDVHHGNGTEAIVKNLIPSKIFHEFSSIPFTGVLYSDSYKPWFDEEDYKNVLFISSHAYGSDSFGKFYPASGTYCSAEDLRPAGILNIPLAKPTDSATFRLNYRNRVFPRLLEFSPDLLMVSAGFDAHGLDSINHGFTDLDEDDYRWVTEELAKIANTCCRGRIISVLEGGYSVRGGLVSALGQSVAAHVKALMRASQEHFSGDGLAEDSEKMELKLALRECMAALKRSRRKCKQSFDAEEKTEESPHISQKNGEPPLKKLDSSDSEIEEVYPFSDDEEIEDSEVESNEESDEEQDEIRQQESQDEIR